MCIRDSAHRDPVGGSQIFVGSKREIPWRPQLNCGNVGNHVKPIERNPMEGPFGDRCPAEMPGHEYCTQPGLQAGYDGSSATNIDAGGTRIYLVTSAWLFQTSLVSRRMSSAAPAWTASPSSASSWRTTSGMIWTICITQRA